VTALRAYLVRVIDGDTAEVRADLFSAPLLGMRTEWRIVARLARIQAWEASEPGGTEAKAALDALLKAPAYLLVDVVKPDKYGKRFDCEIVAGGVNASDAMVAGGHAAYWTGRGPKPLRSVS
jgi:endonuclease YncB( thermonuclease family)